MNIYIAKWIQRPSEDHGQAFWLRKTFTLDDIPEKADLFCAAAGVYEVYINGEKADDRVLAPAPLQYDKHIEYTVYPVKHLLKKGKNVIAFILGNGFFNCWENDYSKLNQAVYRDFPKVMAYVDCGNDVIVKTDDTWKTAKSGVVFNSLRHGEFYDANCETPGVHDADTDDSAWTGATVCMPPGGLIVPEQGHPCKVMQKIDPVDLKVFTFGRRIYDFGVNIAGWCELTISAPPGTTIYIEYGEMVNDIGDLTREYIHLLDNSRVWQEDRFTVGPSGRLENIHARFTWYGFRYIRMRAEHPDIRIEKIQACAIYNSFEAVGSYKSSNAVLDKLLELTKRSFESNFVGIPTDCPHREKNGWTGDVQLACETGLFLYDAMTDYGHFLDCVTDTQRPNGQVPCVAPSGAWGYNSACGPAWDMVMFVVPYQIYRFTGNDEYIKRYYDNMVRYIDLCRQLERGEGLLVHGLGDWCPVEHFRLARNDVTSTGCYYDILRKMTFFASYLGKKEDAEFYQEMACRIKKAFNNAFVNDDGVVGDDSWAALSCAVFFDLVPEAAAERITARLVDKIRANAHRVDFGILGAKYVPHVLARFGYVDDVIKMFTQPEYPGWGNWVARGATTLWETWSGLHSRNHIMFGDVSNWCFEHLGGIIMDVGKVILAPKFTAELDNFECSYKVYGKGVIKTAWQRQEDGSIQYSVSTEDGVEARIVSGDFDEVIPGGTANKVFTFK